MNKIVNNLHNIDSNTEIIMEDTNNSTDDSLNNINLDKDNDSNVMEVKQEVDKVNDTTLETSLEIYNRYNISFGIPDVLFTLTINNSTYKENVIPLIVKMFIIRTLNTANLLELSKLLEFFRMEELNIISIDNFEINHKRKELIVESPTKVRYTEISRTDFMDTISDTSTQNKAFLGMNKNTLYVVRNGSYADIKKIFKNINGAETNIGRGGSQKAHMLSPQEFRLSAYIMALFNFDYSYITYLNTFNDIQKDRYLDIEQNPQFKSVIKDSKFTYKSVSDRISSIARRKYHTSTRKELNSSTSIVSSKEVAKNLSVFSYLDQIDELTNNSTSLQDAQQKIETSWISLMKQKLEDPNISTWRMLPELIKKGINTLDKFNSAGITKKRFKAISFELQEYKHEIVLLTIAMLISNYNKTGATNISVMIGRNIAYLLFKKSLIIKEDMDVRSKFEEWKIIHNIESSAKLLKLGDYYVNLFTNEPTQIFEFGLDDDDSIDTSSERIIKISPEYIDMIKESLIVHPTSLPMLCEPLEWSDTKYGGFIENKTDQNPINTGSSHQGHKITQRESLYKAINNLNKIKFNINKELLEFIHNDGDYLLDDDNDKKDFQKNITLKVANIYSKYNFYLNVNSDWRSRLYTNSFFLSYQGGDLSRSLIEFAEGEKLTNEGVKYLYIFGANCYSNVLGKKSINQRVAWVKRNLTKIIELDKIFLNKSNKKLQFAAFCFAVKNYQLNNDYKVKLPVFLDATCSGLQHLAAMLHDVNLATHVNLLTTTEKDNVNDLYQSMVTPINNEINRHGKDNPIHSNLKNVELTRDILKQSIMTQVYSVTVKGIFGQLTKKFKKHQVLDEKSKTGKEINSTFFLVPTKKGKEVSLSFTDVYRMAEIIKNASFNLYPSLKEIYTYFIDSAKLTSELTIPLVWFTPAGLEIHQYYYSSKINKVTLSYFGKTRTSVLRDWEPILNKNKQNQSIIPNIIHSLDASHLINVINCGYSKDIWPIISIHDCFGTHPNLMGKLADIVRSEFVLLYTEHNFLEKYNERLLNAITDNSYEIIEKDGDKFVLYNKSIKKKDGTCYLSKRKLLVPKVPEMGNLDLKEILNATYLIN